MFSDTPKGKDADSYSPTLRYYHKLLWSKPLPNGTSFDLDTETKMLLHSYYNNSPLLKVFEKALDASMPQLHVM